MQAEVTGLQLDSSIAGATAKERLTDEERLARECQRKRGLEAERRTRIFNAKAHIAVDKDTLDQQVAEAKQKKLAEREFQISGDAGLLSANKAVVRAAKEASKKKSEDMKEARNFNQELGAEQRSKISNERLARLHDPPARTDDLDPRCGVASLQKFAGEDLMQAERLRQQRLMQIDCIEQQKFEKAMIKRMEQEESRRFADEVAEITQMRNEMEEGEFNLRRELQRTNLQENVQKGDETAAQKQRRQELELANNAAEIDFHAEDGFLNESNPQTLASGRVRRDAYKGKTRVEREMAQADIRQQAEEKQMMKEMMQSAECQNNIEVARTHKQLEAMERQKQRTRKAMQAQMVAENQRLAEEAKLRKKDLDELYTNVPSQEYFNQFGTSTR